MRSCHVDGRLISGGCVMPDDDQIEAGKSSELAAGTGYLDEARARREARQRATQPEEEAAWDFSVELQKEIHDVDWQVRHAEMEETPIEQSTNGLQTALLLLGIDMRYNERAGEIEWNFNETEFPQSWSYDMSGGWASHTDLVESRVRETIAENFMFDSGKPAMWSGERWSTSLNSLADFRRIDPFLEWVKKLSWEGESLLDEWLTSVFRVVPGQDPDLVRWASRQILIAACKRAELPGAKMDQMVVLTGPQGIGKSQCLGHLLPSHDGDWFSDSFNFMLDDKERVESTLGAVIVEVGEMAGSTRQEAAKIKQDMARTVDKVRLAYRRNAERFPRRHVRVGTSNGMGDLPNDPTGLRRFVPIDLLGVSNEIGEPKYIGEWMDEHRDQLWAEAWERRGEPIFTEGSLNQSAALAAEAHRYSDEVLESLAAEFVETKKGEPFTSLEFAKWLDDANYTGRSDPGRIKRALLNSGCAYKPAVDKSGKRARMYCPPDDGKGTAAPLNLGDQQTQGATRVSRDEKF